MGETARIESPPPRTKICGNNLDSMAQKKGKPLGLSWGLASRKRFYRKESNPNNPGEREASYLQNVGWSEDPANKARGPTPRPAGDAARGAAGSRASLLLRLCA